jgi:hypothetical protein
LWTLWTHYSEGQNKFLPGIDGDIGWGRFIRESSSSGSSQGRLPVEAWIFRDLMADPDVRSSYIRNAVEPFVDAMEGAGGKALGYEVMNEPDIVWDECGHTWTRSIAGLTITPQIPTHWRLGRSDIRQFVADCADAIRTTLRQPDKLVLSSVQGMVDSCTPHELSLLEPAGMPHVDLAPPHLRYVSDSAEGATRSPC